MLEMVGVWRSTSWCSPATCRSCRTTCAGSSRAGPSTSTTPAAPASRARGRTTRRTRGGSSWSGRPRTTSPPTWTRGRSSSRTSSAWTTPTTRTNWSPRTGRRGTCAGAGRAMARGEPHPAQRPPHRGLRLAAPSGAGPSASSAAADASCLVAQLPAPQGASTARPQGARGAARAPDRPAAADESATAPYIRLKPAAANSTSRIASRFPHLTRRRLLPEAHGPRPAGRTPRRPGRHGRPRGRRSPPRRGSPAG
ncbi:hypothetical protein SVIOM74S_04798 [Streptomyces violarus]